MFVCREIQFEVLGILFITIFITNIWFSQPVGDEPYRTCEVRSRND
jgi:hypothetical protein